MFRYDDSSDASKDHSVNSCSIVAFRSAKDRYFRGEKGDTNYPNAAGAVGF